MSSTHQLVAQLEGSGRFVRDVFIRSGKAGSAVELQLGRKRSAVVAAQVIQSAQTATAARLTMQRAANRRLVRMLTRAAVRRKRV